jgi:hypothetical protein
MYGFQQNETSKLFNTNKGVNYDDSLGCGFSKQANLNGIVSDGLVYLIDASKQDLIQKNKNILPDLIFKNNAQLNQGAQVQDYYSGSVFLDGVNDNITIPNSNKFPSNIGTWSIWFYYSNNVISGASLIRRHTYTGQNLNGIYIYLNQKTKSLTVIFWGSSNINLLILTSPINSILNNTWNNVSLTFNNNKTSNLYINGLLSVSGTPNNTWNFNNQDIIIGSTTNTTLKQFNGYVSNFSVYNRELSASEIMQNYNALIKRFNKINEFDIDIINFIKIANLTTTSQQLAISNLVTDLKSNNLWNKLIAIYPFCGNTNNQFKWNLRDQRDTDEAFRLNFVGTWIYSDTGALPALTDTTYIDTFLKPSGNFSDSLMSLSYYSRTSAQSNTADIGPANWDGNSSFIYAFLRTASNLIQFRFNSSDAEKTISNLDGKGFYNFNRTSTSTVKVIKNTTINTISQNSSGSLPYKILLNGRATDLNGTLFSSSIREISFASIGQSLTDSEALTFYTIVQNYQTTLGRQV